MTKCNFITIWTQQQILSPNKLVHLQLINFGCLYRIKLYYCKMNSLQMSNKDKVIFCTKANHEIPSKYELPPPLETEQRRGIVLPNGQLNWTCPCLGGLPYGPCGFEFREFFGCLHKFKDDESDEPNKAQECFPKFAAMKDCFNQFPKLYPPDEDDDLMESTTSKLQDETSQKKSSEALSEKIGSKSS